MQQGNYTITSTIDLDQPVHVIQGGFPSTATGTDISGYAPQTYVTTITGSTAQMFNKISGIPVSVTLKGLELTGVSYSGGNGAIITSAGNNTTLNFLDLNVHNNAAVFGNGGFAYIQTMTDNTDVVNISNCLFENNTALNNGGAIEFSTVYTSGLYTANTGSYVIRNCSFVGNSGPSDGGALYFTTAAGFTITNNSFCSNTTSGSAVGSGMYMSTIGAMLLDSNTFNNNTAGGTLGTAIYLASVSGNGITINHDTTDNQAGQDIYTATISGSITQTISNSSLEYSAGAYSYFAPTGTGNVYSTTPVPRLPVRPMQRSFPPSGFTLAEPWSMAIPYLHGIPSRNRIPAISAWMPARTARPIPASDRWALPPATAPIRSNIPSPIWSPPALWSTTASRLVDLDGQSSYSNIIALRLSGSAAGVRVFPNPAASLANVETGTAGNYMIELFSIDGRRVQVSQISTGSGLLTVPLNRNNIPTGMYMLKVTNLPGGEPSYSGLMIK